MNCDHRPRLIHGSPAGRYDSRLEGQGGLQAVNDGTADGSVTFTVGVLVALGEAGGARELGGLCGQGSSETKGRDGESEGSDADHIE